MGYRVTFTYGDKTYTLGSLKVRDIEALEALLDAPYVEHRTLATMKHKIAYMAVFLRRDYDEAKVAAIIEDLDLDTVQGMWDIVDDDLPNEYEDGLPLAEAATSTDT